MATAVTFLGLHSGHRAKAIMDNPEQKARYIFDTYFIGQLKRNNNEKQAAQLLLEKVAIYIKHLKPSKFLQVFIDELQRLIQQIKSDQGYCCKLVISTFGDYQEHQYRLRDSRALAKFEYFIQKNQ